MRLVSIDRAAIDRTQTPCGVRPTQPEGQPIELDVAVPDGYAQELSFPPLLQCLAINQKVVDREAPLLDDCPHLRKTGVLIPASTLVEPGES
jgi:hypothetical protein